MVSSLAYNSYKPVQHTVQKATKVLSFDSSCQQEQPESVDLLKLDTVDPVKPQKPEMPDTAINVGQLLQPLKGSLIVPDLSAIIKFISADTLSGLRAASGRDAAFVKTLARSFFTENELSTSNCFGGGGRNALDSARRNAMIAYLNSTMEQNKSKVIDWINEACKLARKKNMKS